MILKRIYTLFIFLFWFSKLFAQNENNIWYFGYHAGIEFSTGVPLPLSGSMIHTDEGCSIISDSIGVKFYTDGVTIWDRNHDIMINGDSLAGGSSATQSALVVPFPSNSNLYYIFTVDAWFQNNEFNYSVIDMSLNSGLGVVTIKNQFIANNISEKLTAVKHSNGSDIWVMVHGFNNNTFHSYLVTSSGVSNNPISTSIGPVASGNASLGYMKFSPPGNKIAFAAHLSGYVALFDFNSSSGVVFNEIILNIPGSTGPYGIEFSSSGNFLYSTASNELYQWDVTSSSDSVIISSLEIIGQSSDYLGALQMGPDGKIYIAKVGRQYLGAIENPELPGLLSSYNSNGAILGVTDTCFLALPNFIQSYFLTTELKEIKIDKFNVFPNPFITDITIDSKSFLTYKSSISIFDIFGKQVYTSSINKLPVTNLNVQLGFLEDTIYFIQILQDNRVFTIKLIKKQVY